MKSMLNYSILSISRQSVWYFFIFALLIPTFSIAQSTNNTPKPNPRQILARGAQEIGGREKLATIFSKQIFGTFTRKSDGASGTIEIFTRQPDNYFLRINHNNQTEQISFDGVTGYRWKSGEQVNVLRDKELGNLDSMATHWNNHWYQNELVRPGKLQKTGSFILSAGITAFIKSDYDEYKGEEIWQGKKTHKIRTYLNQGAAVELNFDFNSGLLIKEEFASNTETVIYEYDDYRKTDEILAPYYIKMSNSVHDVYEIKIQRIVLNQALPNELFEMPKAAQISQPPLEALLTAAITHQEKTIQNYDRLNYLLASHREGTATDSDSGNTYHWSQNNVTDISFHRGFVVKISNERGTGWRDMIKVLKTGEVAKPDAEKAKSRAKLIKQIDERYSKAQAKGIQLSPLEGLAEYKDIWSVDILTILQSSRFTNYRQDTVDKVQLLAVDFFHPALIKPHGEALKNARGTLWFDEKSMAVTKAKIYAAETFKKNTAQQVNSFVPALEMKQEQICDDLWLPIERFDFPSGTTMKFVDYRLTNLDPVCDANNKSKLK